MAAGPDCYDGMLEFLQRQDREIDQILVYCKFVVAYVQHDWPKQGWRKANIEGPIYIYCRRVAPRFRLLVKNMFSLNDLVDVLHPDWELDCQTNYVIYKTEDPSERIRGLWFHDDSERKIIETTLSSTLSKLRLASTLPPSLPASLPVLTKTQPARPNAEQPQVSQNSNVNNSYPSQSGFAGDRGVPRPYVPVMTGEPQLQMQPACPTSEQLPVSQNLSDNPYHQQDGFAGNSGVHSQSQSITMTEASLGSVLHGLANDMDIVKLIMRKLQAYQRHQ